ncbi:MAG TPA: PspC domain-containing protein [Roseateles sp.]|uniref:PspC domain-containing protein n=1 Tax=Roseateles sp. TaxID=1971397 RepID=UPI002EDA5AF0
MSMADELERLQKLHASGALSDDEYVSAKALLLERQPASAARQFRRSREGAWLAGVCAGLGQFSGVPAMVWRAGFLLFLPAAGLSVLLYTLMAFFVPIES